MKRLLNKNKDKIMLGRNLVSAIVIIGVFQIMLSCTAKNDNPGLEYAPNMYHSVPYEGLSQITDEDEGKWLSNREDGKGEYYNTNTNNPHLMNMREPVPGTVRREKGGYLPYRIPKDSVLLAGRVLTNPLDSSSAVLAEGNELYLRFCSHCHGETGQADGLVGNVFLGVPSYNVGRVKDIPEGEIYHVISLGKGRMMAHGSQLSAEERWKIVRYVQVLQNQQ
jgi:mono/diheme cytochrome c family protein